MDFGKVGIWRYWAGVTPEMAAELEELGYGTIWLGGSPPTDLEHAEKLLDATSTVVVGTSIVNMWTSPADEVARSYHRIAAKHPDRFLLGVGIGHPESTTEYRKPYDVIVSYLDELDAAGVPVAGRALAALGPQVLKLSARRTAGALPYFITPEYTRAARETLGPDALLVGEHKATLETDPEKAREIARPVINRYLSLVNYRTNLLRHGWTEADVSDGGSDRIVDALALHGDVETVARGITAHLDAGADHVCFQMLPMDADPMPGFRTLAPLVLG